MPQGMPEGNPIAGELFVLVLVMPRIISLMSSLVGPCCHEPNGPFRPPTGKPAAGPMHPSALCQGIELGVELQESAADGRLEGKEGNRGCAGPWLWVKGGRNCEADPPLMVQGLSWLS